MALASTRLTGPPPNPRPPADGALASQSATEAPSGRVTTYAAQKATIGLSPNRTRATATAPITAA